MAMNLNAPMPQPALPMIDPATGIITDVWFRFLTALLNRTGGTSGTFSGVLAEIVANQSRAAEPITLGISPFTYTAPSHGSVLVSGPGVIRVELTDNGTIWYATGANRGAFPLNPGSMARLTYIGTPEMTFLPG